MRILVDVNEVEWDEAWAITQATFAYTNHTLLPEALESWPVPLIERLLPRHMQIIYVINAAHLDSARRRGFGDAGLLAAISLIDEHGGRRVRMGNLAFVGSHRINGVSALHTELMSETVFRDLERDLSRPHRQQDQRHHVPPLADPVQSGARRHHSLEASASACSTTIDALKGLRRYADDAAVQERVAAARRADKVALARLIAEQLGVRVDPDALFDVQIKRIHEYKRQLLNILETIALYNAIRANPTHDWVPRVKIFAGKAAASYHQAKLIIKLANDVARVVNARPDRARPAQGRVPAQLQRQPGRDDHAGRRPVRADLDRRHGSLGHRQHEVRAERRADHRHARRRQRRDPRAASATTTSSSSA